MTTQIPTDPWQVAAQVVDPELPMVTVADLGILREVRTDPRDPAMVEVTITPTYAACPALAEIRADLRGALNRAGYCRVAVRTVLSPPWSSAWITAEGRRKLAAHGVSPPGQAAPAASGPVTVSLAATRLDASCPRCGCADTELLSRFGPTPCTALARCRGCREPFEHVKEI
ncbi:1,2-phenylacetyl-CoA epoxidase subunit PaaD [Lipingzhangella sp. LS1_29]|uniref:1,2-phenylacetyl-CoA epoxidase subunit PaaD n=1 Tax=Lipingzhangella rawalii TaxID=2055835 RepID=A0ABU2H7Y8_9ACTN|nr:1,2-phenylacetyl-CoA epoxidase subunit PaaD [Lipingzhangella rawalii]MDS1271416.1 1,2-phenylacetyl-CoA epoxidase subunit PaaD [Lipingzhangella rawalii]